MATEEGSERVRLCGVRTDDTPSDLAACIAAAKTAREERRYAEAIGILQTAMASRQQLDALYYQLGNVYYDAGDLDAAEQAYRRVIELNPNHVNAHHNLGVLLKRTGRLGEAVQVRRRGLRIKLSGAQPDRQQRRRGSNHRFRIAALLGLSLFGLLVLARWIGGRL